MEHAIEAFGLTKHYPGDVIGVDDLSLSVEYGEIFGFLGPSGAGKSTTQKIIYKILSGFDGNVRIADKALDQWGKEYFEKIGVGFELPNHYLKLSAKENLELLLSLRK